MKSTLVNKTGRKLLRLLVRELRFLVTHEIINTGSNILGENYLARRLRRGLLQLYGAKFGAGTHYIGKSYYGGAKLVTGANCALGRSCFFDFSAPIKMGDNVTVAHGVTFITARHELGESVHRAGPVRSYPIFLGDGVWIGANATIFPGVTVGKGAVVAAGAVVNKDVPPDVIVAGVPARVIRQLEVDS